ncbi:MAG: hypothetical protein OEQ12_04215 [Nitrosopumilus sp.]|nr:hypothetical protein [Nitrosopumilus sp.]
MKKSGILLAIVGGLIGVGIILSFYGNYVIFEDLVKGDGDIDTGKDLMIEVELDHTETKKGIYAVQIIDFENSLVGVSILDPVDRVVESQSINEEVYEGLFDVSTSGTYKLLIENSGEKVKIFGVIGPEPDSGKRSLGFVSLYILIIGLIGMVIVAVYLVISRKRASN